MAGLGPRDSWRQCLCSGRRVIFILAGLLAAVTLSIVVFGSVGRKYSAALWTVGEDAKTFNRTIATEFAALQQKETINTKTLLKLEQMVKNLTEEAAEVKSQFHDQINKLQGTLRKLDCDLENTKHNWTRPPRGCCPRGWHLFQQSCYWLSKEQKTWPAAKEDCEGKSAHLAAITSYLEGQFVVRLVKPHSTWIGLKFNGQAWKWVDGTPYTVRRIDWRPNEPNNFVFHCTIIYRDGRWNDVFCRERYNWLCEMRTVL